MVRGGGIAEDGKWRTIRKKNEDVNKEDEGEDTEEENKRDGKRRQSKRR